MSSWRSSPVSRALWPLVIASLAIVAFLGSSAPAHAHAFNPALLELTEVGPGTYAVLWKRPTREQRAPDLTLLLPDHCATETEPVRRLRAESLVERWQLSCGAEGLVGHEIGVEGPAVARVDVVTLLIFADGTVQRHVLRSGDTSFTVTTEADSTLGLTGYLRLGITHILGGYDHLLFVLGLTLLVRTPRRLVTTITAFTVGHSLTLSVVALGAVTLPPRPVESLIALSILLLAVELANRTRRGASSEGHPAASLTERHPWAVAAGFGLIHGAGFAGALAEVGLPSQEIPLTLLVFNAGVEVGQLLFVAVVLITLGVLHRAAPRAHGIVQATIHLPIGGLAVLWLIERTTS
jgi:hypothetical protein